LGTIYAGGGTPTILPPAFWRRFLAHLSEITDTSDLKELTIETNPGTAADQELSNLRQAGFNRLSIGIQSFNDSTLQLLHRIHTSAQAIEVFRSARNAGFSNISVDLMYGVPGQTLNQWLEDLEKVESICPEHISCYELSVSEGTPFFDSINTGDFSKPDNEACREMYFAADEILLKAGYIHYETSNYSMGNNFISRHNSSYWSRTPYIGLGPSAHSFDGVLMRSWNVSSLNEYLNRSRTGKSQTIGSEAISREQAAFEMVMLGLRCNIGIDPDVIENETGVCLNTDYLNEMIKNDKLVPSATGLIPTAKGMLFADGDSVNLFN